MSSSAGVHSTHRVVDLLGEIAGVVGAVGRRIAVRSGVLVASVGGSDHGVSTSGTRGRAGRVGALHARRGRDGSARDDSGVEWVTEHHLAGTL